MKPSRQVFHFVLDVTLIVPSNAVISLEHNTVNIIGSGALLDELPVDLCVWICFHIRTVHVPGNQGVYRWVALIFSLEAFLVAFNLPCFVLTAVDRNRCVI
ncbi:UNVERIFIED_CONTAM: hypothetical protein K2H54_023132 [Gekko kuhli]